MKLNDVFEKKICGETFQPQIKIAGKWISLEVISDTTVMFGKDEALEMFEVEYGKEVREEIERNLI